MDNFDPYNVFLAIATNLPVLIMTGFVVQGLYIYIYIYILCIYILYICTYIIYTDKV